MTRKAIGKKVRFEVFKRDSFTCQYCGASAPEAILHVDHIHPVSKGGDNSILNYITSCQPCNAGKSDKLLSDDSAILKQKAQLDQLNARREQLEMMMQWREAMSDLGQAEVDEAVNYWKSGTPGYTVNDKGALNIKKMIKKYGLMEVLDSMEIAQEGIVIGDDGKVTADTIHEAWERILKVLRYRAMPEQKRQIHYCRGILKNRLSYVNPTMAVELMTHACDSGIDIDELQDLCKSCRSWTDFRDSVWALIDGAAN